MNEYIRVFLVDLPHKIHGFSTKNDDDSFTILINSRLSNEMQIEAYNHEIAHITNSDFDSCCNVNELESDRHIV